MLDFNKDGKIDYEDLLVNFKLLLENSLNEEQISEIVKKTISEYSSDQTYITFEEFLRVNNSIFNNNFLDLRIISTCMKKLIQEK